MNNLFKEVERLMMEQKWNDEFESLKDPKLLATSCMYVVKKFLEPTFDKDEFAILVAQDSLVRELFRVAFYYALVLRDGTKKQTPAEKNIFVKEETADIMRFWKNASSNFCDGNPVFDADTFWTYVTYEFFTYENNEVTFPEMFAAVVTYALSEEMALYILEVLRTIVSHCKDGDAKVITAELGVLCEDAATMPILAANEVALGTFFHDTADDVDKVYLEPKISDGKLIGKKYLFVTHRVLEGKCFEEVIF